MLDPHGHQVPQYKCEMENGIGCNKKGCCTNSTSITDMKDIFIIQLMIISYDKLGNTRKTIPNLKIDPEIRSFDLIALQGVIWHKESSMNSGHYTYAIKLNNIWFICNDAAIRGGGRLVCSNNDYITPYILCIRTLMISLFPNYLCQLIQINFSMALIMLKN